MFKTNFNSDKVYALLYIQLLCVFLSTIPGQNFQKQIAPQFDINTDYPCELVLGTTKVMCDNNSPTGWCKVLNALIPGYYKSLDALFNFKQNYVEFKSSEGSLYGELPKQTIDTFIKNEKVIVDPALHNENIFSHALPPIPEIDFLPDTSFENTLLYPRCVIAKTDISEGMTFYQTKNMKGEVCSVIPITDSMLYVFHTIKTNNGTNSFLSHIVCNDITQISGLEDGQEWRIPGIATFVEVNNVQAIDRQLLVKLFDMLKKGIIGTLSLKVQDELAIGQKKIGIDTCTLTDDTITLYAKKDGELNNSIVENVVSVIPKRTPKNVIFVLDGALNNNSLSIDVAPLCVSQEKMEIVMHNFDYQKIHFSLGGISLFHDGNGVQNFAQGQTWRFISDNNAYDQKDPSFEQQIDCIDQQNYATAGFKVNCYRKKELDPYFEQDHAVWINIKHLVFSTPALQYVHKGFIEHIGMKNRKIKKLRLIDNSDYDGKKNIDKIDYTFCANEDMSDKYVTCIRFTYPLTDYGNRFNTDAYRQGLKGNSVKSLKAYYWKTYYIMGGVTALVIGCILWKYKFFIHDINTYATKQRMQ